MPLTYKGTDIISLKNAIFNDIIILKEGVFMSENKLLNLSFEFAVAIKKVFLLLLVFVVLFSFTACTLSLEGLRLFMSQNAGIQDFEFYKKGDNVCLKVEYFDCKGYSVEILENDDVIIQGERPVKFQNLIGENAVKIALYETKFEKLLKDYDTFSVYNVHLEGTDLKFMLCPDVEHSLYIYVGFEDNIKTFAKEYTEINIPLGAIHFELGEHK